MEAASAGEIRTDETDETAIPHVSVCVLLSSWSLEPYVHNPQTNVQGLPGLWAIICIAKSLAHAAAQRCRLRPRTAEAIRHPDRLQVVSFGGVV
jgi:hypothetical protein